MHEGFLEIFTHLKFTVCGRSIDTRAQCSRASVGFAQAHPNNAVFIRNESLFFVSAIRAHAAVATQRMPEGYRIWTIEYGKILVVSVYGEYYERVYKVYNK